MRNQKNMKQIIFSKLLKVLTYLSIVLQPVVPALIWLGIFVVVNLATEIWEQTKTKRITRHSVSDMLRRLISSTILYFVFIIVARGFDVTVLPGDPLPFTAVQIAIGICAIREIKPIFENIGIILGIDIWAYFKDKLKIPGTSE